MISRQCRNCALRIESFDEKNICAAFPDGIPEAIITGEVDHSKPYPGDNGFRYEPLEPDNE